MMGFLFRVRYRFQPQINGPFTGNRVRYRLRFYYLTYNINSEKLSIYFGKL